MLRIFNLQKLSHNLRKKVILLTISFVIMDLVSLYWIFNFVPPDYLQGDLAKIMYVHVPAAWLALALYLALGIFSIIHLITRNIVYDILAHSIASVDCYLTLIAIVTGALWGKPAWGTWWVWDARLTSMLIQLFMLFGYLLLRSNLKNASNYQVNNERISQASSILALLGMINLPIIKFSVNIWNTLHQPSSTDNLFKLKAPKIDLNMIYPLLIMSISIITFAFILIILINAIIKLERKILNLSLIDQE